MDKSALFPILKLPTGDQIQQRSPNQAIVKPHSNQLIYKLALTHKATNGHSPLDLHLYMMHLCFLILSEHLQGRNWQDINKAGMANKNLIRLVFK